MFDWVLNTSLFLGAFFLHGLISLYVQVVIPEYFKNVVSRVQCSSRLQFYQVFVFETLSFLIQIIFGPCVLGFCYWFQNTTFDLMSNCYRIVITSYNSTVLYKINTFIKKQDFMAQLEVNWRKIFKPLVNAVFHIFLQKRPRAWLRHIHSFFVIQTCFTFVLICVNSCQTCVDSSLPVLELC